MTKRWLQFIAGACMVAGLILAAVDIGGCKQEAKEPIHYGSLANTAANVSYAVNGGTAFNLTSSQYPIGLPPNSSVVFTLQSTSGIYQTTFTWACPGYIINPQSFVVRSLDGGNASAITVTTPNLVPSYCTLTTQTWDGALSYANAVNQFSIGTYAMVEVPIFGVTNGDAGSLNPNSVAVIPPGAVITASYLSLGTAMDAACTIQVGQPVDGGNNALFGYYDAGTTLTTTVARENYRVTNEGGPMPIQVNLAAACEAGAGVVGVEWSMPSN